MQRSEQNAAVPPNIEPSYWSTLRKVECQLHTAISARETTSGRSGHLELMYHFVGCIANSNNSSVFLAVHTPTEALVRRWDGRHMCCLVAAIFGQPDPIRCVVCICRSRLKQLQSFGLNPVTPSWCGICCSSSRSSYGSPVRVCACNRLSMKSWATRGYRHIPTSLPFMMLSRVTLRSFSSWSI